MALIAIDEAHSLVLEDLTALEAERVSVAEAAGRVLSTAISCDRPLPPFDRAMMDGFALRSQDIQSTPVTLRVVAEVMAGASYDGEVAPGEAVRIMTGAPVPAGADAVQMLENTRCDSPDTVTVLASVPEGRHVARQGSEWEAGQVVLNAGMVLTPSRLGVCAMVGQRDVLVHRAPRVAILSTGDELVEIGDSPGPYQIRESNRTSVGQLVQSAGGEVVHTAIVPDDEGVTRDAIRNALAQADVLLMSGGISKGDRDLVASCLQKEGVETVFHGVCIKPGKPLFFGRTGEKLVFGLPGNPVSSYVTARLFVLPAIRRLLGWAQGLEPVVTMSLQSPVAATGNRPWLKPATVAWGKGVRVRDTAGSADLSGFAQGNAMVWLPANSGPFSVGDPVQVFVGAMSP
jgi:molybdopterin molybdotransferase